MKNYYYSFLILFFIGFSFFSCTKDETSGSQPTNIELSNTSIDENEPVNTLIGYLTAADPGSTVHTFALVEGSGDEDNASFIIDGDQLKSNAVFDYETKSSYSIRIRTTNHAGNFFTKVFTITVTDVVELADIAGDYLLEFDYSFSGTGISGTSEGSVSSVTITQSGTEIEVRGCDGSIDEDNEVEFSGDFISDGTHHFDGDYNPSTGIISGSLSGSIAIDVWNGLYMEAVIVTITSGTCTLTPK